jgi:hypothetical protein
MGNNTLPPDLKYHVDRTAATKNFEGSGILERYRMQRPQRQSCLPADAVLDDSCGPPWMRE